MYLILFATEVNSSTETTGAGAIIIPLATAQASISSPKV